MKAAFLAWVCFSSGTFMKGTASGSAMNWSFQLLQLCLCGHPACPFPLAWQNSSHKSGFGVEETLRGAGAGLRQLKLYFLWKPQLTNHCISTAAGYLSYKPTARKTDHVISLHAWLDLLSHSYAQPNQSTNQRMGRGDESRGILNNIFFSRLYTKLIFSWL